MQSEVYGKMDLARRAYDTFFDTGAGKGVYKASLFYETAARVSDLSSLTDDELADLFMDVQESLGYGRRRPSSAWIRDFRALYPRLVSDTGFREALAAIRGAEGLSSVQKDLAFASFYAKYNEAAGLDPKGIIEEVELPPSRQQAILLRHPWEDNVYEVSARSQYGLYNVVDSLTGNVSSDHQDVMRRQMFKQHVLPQLADQLNLTPEEQERILRQPTFYYQTQEVGKLIAEKNPQLTSRSVVSVSPRAAGQSLDAQAAQSIARTALEEISNIRGVIKTDSGYEFTGELKDTVRAIDEMLQKHRPIEITRNQKTHLITSVESILGEALGSLNDEQFAAQVLQDSRGRLYLALMRKEHQLEALQSIISQTWEESAHRNKMALLALPEIDQDGLIVGGRINRMFAKYLRRGGQLEPVLENLYVHSVREALGSARYLKERMLVGDIEGAEYTWNRAVRDAVENVAAKTRPFEEVFDFSNMPNENASDYLRAYHFHFDYSAQAEVARRLWGDQAPDPEDFSLQENVAVYRELLGIARDEWGLEPSVVASKPGYTARMVAGSALTDIRSWYPLGYAMNVTREGYRQLFNYNPISQAHIKSLVEAQEAGTRASNIIPHPILTTPTRFLIEQEGRSSVPGLTLKVAFASEQDILARLDALTPEQRRYVEQFALPSLSEEKILMSADAAANFYQWDRPKRFVFRADQEMRIDQSILDALESGETVQIDPGQVIGFSGDKAIRWEEKVQDTPACKRDYR